MRALYLINSHYSKKIKYVKVFILFLTLTLLQVFIPVYYGNEILMDRLEEEGVDLTNYYVPYRRILQFPQKFDTELQHKDIQEIYHVKDYKVRDLFSTRKGYYIEGLGDTNFKLVSKGKALHELKAGEAAVSEYFALMNFGSVRGSIGKTIEIPIEYVVYEGLLKDEKKFEDTLTYSIGAVYKNSAINKRFINFMSNDNNAEDRNENTNYTDTIIVTQEDFHDLYKKYISYDDESHNIYKKYSIYFDEYSLTKEIYLRGRLNFYVQNYNSSIIDSELMHKVLENSVLTNKTTRFFIGFELVSVIFLIAMSLIYLIYLQNKYLYPFRQRLNIIGIRKIKIYLATLLHELFLGAVGIGVWLVFNILLKVIFEIRMVYLQDFYQFNSYILRNAWIPIGIYVLSLTTSYILSYFTYFISKKSTVKLKAISSDSSFSINFYALRMLSLHKSKYAILLIIALLVSGCLFFINGAIQTMKRIYVDSNPFKYDVFVNLQVGVVPKVMEGVSAWATYNVSSESFLMHHYGEGLENQKSMLVTSVLLYGDYETFFKAPKKGDIPKYTETIGDFVEKYPHRSYPQEIYNERIGFDMLVSNAVAKRLDIEVGSYGIIMLEELNYNVPMVYPISGITNIFSNDMNTVYIVPGPERQAMIKNPVNSYPTSDKSFTRFMFIYDNDEKKEEAIKKLKEYQKTGEVKDLRINDGRVRLNDIGELNTLLSMIILTITLGCYAILLSSIIWAKKTDDEMTQEVNIQVFYNIGAESRSLMEAFKRLNMTTLLLGVSLGFIIYLSLSGRIKDYIYEIMEVIK